jgi:hypothetical protein
VLRHVFLDKRVNVIGRDLSSRLSFANGIAAVSNLCSRILGRVTRLGERERWILAEYESPL